MAYLVVFDEDSYCHRAVAYVVADEKTIVAEVSAADVDVTSMLAELDDELPRW